MKNLLKFETVRHFVATLFLGEDYENSYNDVEENWLTTTLAFFALALIWLIVIINHILLPVYLLGFLGKEIVLHIVQKNRTTFYDIFFK